MIYRFFRLLWRLGLAGFFRCIRVHGLDRIPATGPVLLVANHTNAFVDPLLLLTRLRRPLTLTAKSTLAKSPLLLVPLRALRVVLFHRSQDREAGADPRRNASALDRCRRILEAGGAVLLFPEGVSHSDPTLRRFRTGAARLALDFHEANPPGRGRSGLVIIAVGLHFERKEAFRSDASVIIGSPVDAARWLEANPGAGARELTAAIEEWIRELTTNFESEAERALFHRAAALLTAGAEPPAPLDRLEPDRTADVVATIHRLQQGAHWLRDARPAEYRDLATRVRRHWRRLDRLGLSPGEANLPVRAGRAAFFVLRELEILVVGLPLALWGTLNHWPAYAVTRALTRRLSTDLDHFASNAVFLGIPVFLLCYLLQVGAAMLLLPPPGAAAYAALLPLTGAVALHYRDRSGGVARRVRTFFLFLRRPRHQARLAAEARDITDRIRRLANEWERHG